MGANPRFVVALGLKWGILKYSDFPNFSKIKLVLFANKKKKIDKRGEFCL